MSNVRDDCKLYSKLCGISQQDVDMALKSLQELFKQRQLFAKACLQTELSRVRGHYIDAIKYMDNEISNALFLFPVGGKE